MGLGTDGNLGGKVTGFGMVVFDIRVIRFVKLPVLGLGGVCVG